MRCYIRFVNQTLSNHIRDGSCLAEEIRMTYLFCHTARDEGIEYEAFKVITGIGLNVDLLWNSYFLDTIRRTLGVPLSYPS